MDEETIEETEDEETGTDEEGEPVDTDDAADSPPVDEEEVDDPQDEGVRPDVDWDETGVEDDANAQREFTSQPIPPYRPGDIWDDNGTEYVCVTGKTATQSYSADDWVPAVTPYVAPTTTTVTITTEEIITDYSAESLAAYAASGAVAYAVYEDGTRAQVAWSQVVQPAQPIVQTVANEAEELARATNQHFWSRTTDEEQDGAGTGAFVTDDEQDDFLEASAGGFTDLGDPTKSDVFTGDGTTTAFSLSGTAAGTDTMSVTVNGTEVTTGITKTTGSVTFDTAPADGAIIRVTYDTGKKPWHNILMNSLGILLRTGLKNLVSITRSAVAFFDGTGNGAENVVASFGADGAQIGKTNSQHAVLDSQGLIVYNGDGTLANVNSVNVNAVKTASDEASMLLDGMQAAAQAAGTTMEGIYQDATRANEAAISAGHALSEVEKVVGTLNWIAEHGTYTLTQDQEIDASKVYYTRSGTDPDFEYAAVMEPDSTQLSSYYELELDESVQNYIVTHLYLASDGLHLIGSQTDYSAALSTNGLEILTPGGTSVATYGETFRIGATDNVHLLGTSTRLAFHTQAGDIAYFGLDDNDTWTMYIDQASVTDTMRFGNYAWVKRENGNMTIKYIQEA